MLCVTITSIRTIRRTGKKGKEIFATSAIRRILSEEFQPFIAVCKGFVRLQFYGHIVCANKTQNPGSSLDSHLEIRGTRILGTYGSLKSLASLTSISSSTSTQNVLSPPPFLSVQMFVPHFLCVGDVFPPEDKQKNNWLREGFKKEEKFGPKKYRLKYFGSKTILDQKTFWI